MPLIAPVYSFTNICTIPLLLEWCSVVSRLCGSSATARQVKLAWNAATHTATKATIEASEAARITSEAAHTATRWHIVILLGGLLRHTALRLDRHVNVVKTPEELYRMAQAKKEKAK